MNQNKFLSIVMLGDVMLGRLVDEALSVLHDRSDLWGDTLPLLRGGMARTPNQQIVAINLECAVTSHHKAAPKTFNFKLSPSNVDVLQAASVRFASLANNHSLDYYSDGLMETQQVLDNIGIAWAGAGTASQAAKPAVITHEGLRIAFMAYSDHYSEWKATQAWPGINFIDPTAYDRDDVANQVASVASQADMVIVFIHWGPNWAWQPSESIQSLAHDLIDFGADAVFGHSAHHIQGIEIRNGRPIVYGAGGYIDDYALDDTYRNDLGFLYCMHVDFGSVRPQELELVPIKITHEWRREPNARPPYFSFVNIAQGNDRSWLSRTLCRLSGPLGTTIKDTPRGLTIPLS